MTPETLYEHQTTSLNRGSPVILKCFWKHFFLGVVRWLEMWISRLFEEVWEFRWWKHHDRRPWPRHQNDTVHSMLSVTIESGCVPRMCVSMCASVFVRRWWITLSPVWRPQYSQISHTVSSSSWNPWTKTIPDNHIVPTFYKRSQTQLGWVSSSGQSARTGTWALFIGIPSWNNEIHRSVCTTSNQQQVPFCRCCLFWKKILFVSLPVDTDFCLHLQKTVSMRTTRCW